MGATPVLKTYFMLTVMDMDRALRFYTELFAVSQRFSSPEWTEFDVAGATVTLHPGGRAGDTESGLGFEVADLRAVLERAVSLGGRVTRTPRDRPAEGIVLAELADTEGNRITLAQPSGRWWAGNDPGGRS